MIKAKDHGTITMERVTIESIPILRDEKKTAAGGPISNPCRE
jgi:hypothetical protein